MSVTWRRVVLFCIFLMVFYALVQCKDEEPNLTGDANKEEDNHDFTSSEDFVLILTAENFDEIVDKYPTILAEFYTPWCENCKTFAPVYAVIADELSKHDPPVTVVKVDVSIHKDIATRFDITVYPTLRFFRNGKHYEYDGPISKDGIVDYMKKVAHPEWQPEPDFAVSLNKENFEDVVNKEHLMLVNFYTPQCDGCIQLVYAFEKAAKMLNKEVPPILLAKVDASQETELAARYKITDYPTLKVFRNGRAIDFRGSHVSAYDIVYHMKKLTGPGAREIKNAKMLKEFFLPDQISIVGFFDSPESKNIGLYKDLTIEIRDDFHFGIVFNEDLQKAYDIKANSVVVFSAERFHTQYEPHWYTLEITDESTSDEIFEFMKNHHLPLVGQYSRPRINHYDKTRPLCLVFYTVNFSFDHKDATQFWRHKIADIAYKHPDITFAIADDEDQRNLMEQFGLDESGEEINIGLFGTDGKKYAMPPMDEFDSSRIISFLNDYRQGKLKPYIKSQRPPKTQAGPLTVVVGETFEQIVKDTDRDVLIELYSPWCEYCRQVEAKLEILAKKLKAENNLVIAKIDAIANDLPVNYTASGFPTIYFAPASNKDSPVKYEGPRHIEDIEKFMRKNAVVSFEKSEREEL